MRKWPVLSVVILAAAAALAACGSGGSNGSTGSSGSNNSPAGKKLQVVAAENFWGSIATQLGGSKVSVQSVIVNPNTDPHDYQPTASDARAMAGAQLAIVNGIDYDTWASRLLAANPVSGRTTLAVGDLLGLEEGDNPHQWYSPGSVRKVIAAIVADYQRLDPADKAYFAEQKRHFETVALAQYNQLRAEIRRRFGGVPVGYSESIFRPLGASVGLKLVTPYSFANAVSEGTEISAKDKQTVDRQAQNGLIKVWVYNSQNATPDIQRINAICRSHHIPIATVTETLSPATDNYEQWQAGQLKQLIAALHQATRR
jgi:zinc/manganese transport system substrate-binding protein